MHAAGFCPIYNQNERKVQIFRISNQRLAAISKPIQGYMMRKCFHVLKEIVEAKAQMPMLMLKIIIFNDPSAFVFKTCVFAWFIMLRP